MMNDLTMDPAFGRYRPSWRICVIELIEIETIGPSGRSYDHKYDDYCFFLSNRHLNTHNLLDDAKKHNVALQLRAHATRQRGRLTARQLQAILRLRHCDYCSPCLFCFHFEYASSNRFISYVGSSKLVMLRPCE
jgi:hypothetical protein